MIKKHVRSINSKSHTVDANHLTCIGIFSTNMVRKKTQIKEKHTNLDWLNQLLVSSDLKNHLLKIQGQLHPFLSHLKHTNSNARSFDCLGQGV